MPFLKRSSLDRVWFPFDGRGFGDIPGARLPQCERDKKSIGRGRAGEGENRNIFSDAVYRNETISGENEPLPPPPEGIRKTRLSAVRLSEKISRCRKTLP